MARYLLDTTFIIDHLRGDLTARARMAGMVELGDILYVNEIVVTEAWSGAHADDDPDLEALLRFLEFVQPGPGTARRAGRWRANLRREGRTLALGDSLIAAAAHDLGAAVLTRNARDFALTPVAVETY